MVLKILIAAGFLLFSGASLFAKQGSNYVKGYVKKDGTYVAPHQRSNPNSTKNDNWSTKGNTNPYTGKEGTKNPDSPYQAPKNPYSNEKNPE